MMALADGLGQTLHDPTLSYVHGTSDIPLIGATIGDLFDRVAAHLPDQEALVSRHQKLRFTYAPTA